MMCVVKATSNAQTRELRKKLENSGEKVNRKWKGIWSICEGELQGRGSHH